MKTRKKIAVVIGAGSTERIRLFDTARIPSIFEEGASAIEAIMPRLRRLLADGPPELAVA